MKKVKIAFEEMPHVNVVYANKKGEYMLCETIGYDQIITREEAENMPEDTPQGKQKLKDINSLA